MESSTAEAERTFLLALNIRYTGQVGNGCLGRRAELNTEEHIFLDAESKSSLNENWN